MQRRRGFLQNLLGNCEDLVTEMTHFISKIWSPWQSDYCMYCQTSWSLRKWTKVLSNLQIQIPLRIPLYFVYCGHLKAGCPIVWLDTSCYFSRSISNESAIQAIRWISDRNRVSNKLTWTIFLGRSDNQLKAGKKSMQRRSVFSWYKTWALLIYIEKWLHNSFKRFHDTMKKSNQ